MPQSMGKFLILDFQANLLERINSLIPKNWSVNKSRICLPAMQKSVQSTSARVRLRNRMFGLKRIFQLRPEILLIFSHLDIVFVKLLHIFCRTKVLPTVDIRRITERITIRN